MGNNYIHRESHNYKIIEKQEHKNSLQDHKHSRQYTSENTHNQQVRPHGRLYT
jgi:hypothetical protein